jgi:pyruvate dehydrogenase E1 component
MGEVVDGEYQKYTVAGGEYIRDKFWGANPRLRKMVDHLSDDQVWKLRLGGHDSFKVYAAYAAAVKTKGAPCAVLARTIKGYGLGEAGEGRNVTHQQKHLNTQELLSFRDRFNIPLSDEDVAGAPLYRPGQDSAEIRKERRRVLGGYLPQRRVRNATVDAPSPEVFAEFLAGSGGREASTTMVLVRMLASLMRDKNIGNRISCRTRPGRLGWTRSSARSASIRRAARRTTPWTPRTSCTTARRKKGRCWKRESRRPVPCLRLSRPARLR